MTKRIALAGAIITAFIVSSFIIDTDFIESLKDKLWRYLQEHPTTNLHVHTDKNVYSPTEKIWFKAYTLSGSVTDSKVLYIRLTNDKKQIVAKAEFAMYDIRCHGDLALPDTLKDGNYFFYAFTDRMINFSEEDVFVQPILVHRNKKKWQAEAYVIDSGKIKRGSNVEILVRLKQDNNFIKDIKGKYQLFDGDKIVRQRTITTNNIGEAYINFIYPDIADDRSLTAKIIFETETDFEEVNLNLRHEGNQLKAAFYPEGGHFVEAITNKLAIAIKDVNHNPVATQVLLKRNNQTIATTTSNILGIATLPFTPLAIDNYTLEIDNYGTKQTLPFKPIIETHGYTITTQLKDGNCFATITNKGEKSAIFLVARALDDVVWGKELNIAANTSQTITIPINDYVKQLLSLDLMDAKGNIMAERLLLNKQEDDYHIAIKTDTDNYGIRKKVTVNITVTDKNGQPVSANCSMAVVEKNTLDETLATSIINTYQYKNTQLLNHFLVDNNSTTEGLNNLLLTQKWNDYQWENVMPFSPQGKLIIKKNTDGVCGTITAISKKNKDFPKTLNILSNSGIMEVVVSASGYFYIPSTDLFIENNKTKVLVLNHDFYEKYNIDFMAYDANYDKLVTTSNQLDLPKPFSTLIRYKKTKLDSVPGIKRLDDVLVKSFVHNGITEREMEMIQRELCTSYVCINNILNCPNHKGGTPPIPGNRYTLNGHSVIYTGCYDGPIQKTRIALKSILLPTDFPVIDYDKDPSKEPEVRTTLYWNPNIYTNKAGNATLTFFTNDIKSSFKIVVQGVTVKDVKPLQGSYIFMVK